MDSFLQEIADKLQEENLALNREIEPELKQLMVKSFNCMSDCFKTQEPISSAGECADRCNSSIQQSQNEIEKHINHIQSSFQNCMQGCGLKVDKADNSELRQCITVCANESIANFADVRKLSKEIIRKYL